MSILLLPYLVLLRFSGFFISPPALLQDAGIAADGLFQLIAPASIAGQVTAILLLLLQSFVVNYIVLEHRLMNTSNLLPGLFYALLASAFPDFLYLSPVLLANTFLLFALASALSCYKNNFAATSIFNMGLWIGVASLFYGSIILFVIWGILALTTLRSFQLKEINMVLLGAFVPYLFLGTFSLWNGEFIEVWQTQISGQLSFLSFQGLRDIHLMIKLGVFALFILFALLSYGGIMTKKNMPVQKKITVIYQMLLISGLALFIQFGASVEHLLLAVISLGLLLGLRFSDMTSRASESLHFLMVVLILFYQFLPKIAG